MARANATRYHRPWYHWFSNDNLNITKCLKAEEAQSLINVPYIGPSGYFHPDSAENLEKIIENSVTNWFKRRLQNDFFEYDESKKRQVRRQSPSNVKRWMAHLLLTTTINIGAGQSENGNVSCWKPPLDGFLDMEKASLLSTDFSFFENLACILTIFNAVYANFRSRVIFPATRPTTWKQQRGLTLLCCNKWSLTKMTTLPKRRDFNNMNCKKALLEVEKTGLTISTHTLSKFHQTYRQTATANLRESLLSLYKLRWKMRKALNYFTRTQKRDLFRKHV